MNNTRTQPVRAHPSFSNMIKSLQAKKFQQQKRFIRSSRITLAIFNQYNKYPDLIKELEESDLK